MTKQRTLWTYLAYLLCAAAAALFAYSFTTFLTTIHHVQIPFDTDESDHANAGIELFRAIQSHSLSAIFEAIRRQAFYPPIFSLCISVSYAVLHPGIFASRVPSVFFYAFSILFLCVAVWRSSVNRPLYARLVAVSLPALFLASSPLIIEYGTLCMIELAAVALVSALLAHLSGKETFAQHDKAILSFLLAVFFIKYNFGILVIPGFIASCVLTPPWNISTEKKDWVRAVRSAAIAGAFFGAWLLISYRASVIHFFVGHPSYSPLLSAENLLFEVKSWFKEYSANYAVAASTLLLGIYGAVKHRTQPAARISYGITAASFGILLLSTTNEARHFIVAAPCIWYLSSLGIAALLEEPSLRPALLSIAVIASALTGAYKVVPDTRKIIVRGMEGDESFLKLQEGIFQTVDSSKPILVIGVTDQFGIEALRWRAALTSGLSYTKVHVDAFPFRDDKNMTAKMRMRNVAAPYEDPQLVKEPLSEVLKQHHYSNLITLRAVGDRSDLASLIKGMKESYADSITYQKTLGSFEVTVISLQ